jgi:hypothetical protein
MTEGRREPRRWSWRRREPTERGRHCGRWSGNESAQLCGVSGEARIGENSTGSTYEQQWEWAKRLRESCKPPL